MKFTKTHEKQMREFLGKMDANGCIPVTDWVSGSGRFTKPKTLPPFVERFERKEYPGGYPKHGTTERTAFEFFRANHRRKAVLVMDTEAAMAFLFDSAHGKEF